MDAPQSPHEIAPFVEALRQIDPRMDIVWNPRAVIVRRGGYDGAGKLLAPTYAGRWEVILREDNGASKTAEWREFARVCLVSTPVQVLPGVMAMDQEGDYAPIGEWLVQFLRQADYYNKTGIAAHADALDARNARIAASNERSAKDGELEVLDAMWFDGTMEGGVSQFHPVNVALTSTE